MPIYQFGVGTLVTKRTDISGATPTVFGTLQEVDIDISQSLKELTGQYKMAADIAPAELKVTGKAKSARLLINAFNDMLFGGAVTPLSGTVMAMGEAASVPGSTPYTVTSTHSTTWTKDLGVFYSDTGVQLEPVSSGSEEAGKYSVAAGVYTFAAADEGKALSLYYDYTVTTLNKIIGANQLMGVGPTFELHLQNQYTNNSGTLGQMHMTLYACRSSKLSLALKNQDYLVPEFDFQCAANASGNWCELTMTE